MKADYGYYYHLFARCWQPYKDALEEYEVAEKVHLAIRRVSVDFAETASIQAQIAAWNVDEYLDKERNRECASF